MGLGFPFGSDVAEDYTQRGEDRMKLGGRGLLLDVAAGANLTSWLVIGAGLTSSFIGSGSVDNREGSTQALDRGLYFAVLGALLDAYTAPPGGLHFQVLVGLARSSPSHNLGLNTSTGVGAVLGIGYEWPLGPDWSVGAVLRLALAQLSMDPVQGRTLEPALYEPGLVLTATFRPAMGSPE